METTSKLKQYLFVINQISSKDYKRRTSESHYGMLWNVLSPLLYMIIMSTYYCNVVIHNIYKYPVFVMTGYVIINYFNMATTGAMHSLVDNKKLIIRTKLSKEVFIYQRIHTAFKDFLCTLIALAMVMAFFEIKVTPRFVLLIPVLALETIVIIGVSKILAVIYISFGDISYLYSLFMTLMYFVSGVFIPTGHMSEQLQRILSYNPIFLTIYLTRNCLMYDLPSHWSAWLKLTLWAIIAFALGHLVYEKNSNRIVNKL